MHYIDIHTHSNPRPDIPSLVDVSGREDCCFDYEYFSVGIHPKSIGEDWQSQLSKIEQLAQKPSFGGVGECGLDKFADRPRDLQEKVFVEQLLLAQRIAKPVIIHCVRLYTDVLRLLKKIRFGNPVVFHGYNGNPDIAAQLLKLPNTYFSYSAATLAMPGTSGAKSLPMIPAERLLTETDCEQGADLSGVVETIAKIKNLDSDILRQTIYENFMRLMKRL